MDEIHAREPKVRPKAGSKAQWSRWKVGKLRMRAAVDTCTLALPALRSLMARACESVWLWRLQALPHAPHWAALPHGTCLKLLTWADIVTCTSWCCDVSAGGGGASSRGRIWNGVRPPALCCGAPVCPCSPPLANDLSRCPPALHHPYPAPPTLRGPYLAAQTLRSPYPASPPRCAAPTPQPPRCAAPTLQPLLSLPLQPPRWATPTLQHPRCAD